MFVGIFGSITWDVLLLCAINYPQAPDKNHRTNMSQFINGLVHVLPCNGCSTHAIEYVKTNPPDLSSSNKLVEYIVLFHNTINHNTGKRTYTTLEAKKSLFDRYVVDNNDVSRALTIRKEDHAMIIKLQQTIVEQAAYIELQRKTISAKTITEQVYSENMALDMQIIKASNKKN